jgi:hypothetical protein
MFILRLNSSDGNIYNLMKQLEYIDEYCIMEFMWLKDNDVTAIKDTYIYFNNNFFNDGNITAFSSIEDAKNVALLLSEIHNKQIKNKCNYSPNVLIIPKGFITIVNLSTLEIVEGVKISVCEIPDVPFLL